MSRIDDDGESTMAPLGDSRDHRAPPTQETAADFLIEDSDEFPEAAIPLAVSLTKRPSKTRFFSVCPDPAYAGKIWLLKDDDGVDGDTTYYALSPSVLPFISETLRSVFRLYTICYQGGGFVLWHVRVPDPARPNDYHTTAHLAANMARESWIRLETDQSNGRYLAIKAENLPPCETWPKETFSELVALAFGKNLISDADHPVVRRLMGRL